MTNLVYHFSNHDDKHHQQYQVAKLAEDPVNTLTFILSLTRERRAMVDNVSSLHEIPGRRLLYPNTCGELMIGRSKRK
jgi:hypothetical protein